MKRKQFVNYLLWFIILFWAGIANVYWALNPNIASFTDAGLHARAYQMLKGTGAIGPDMLVLALGYWFSRTKSIEKLAIRGWLTTWIVGIATCLVVAVSCTFINATEFTSPLLNTLFPILRNSYPLIFGVILGLFINQVIAQLSKNYQIGVIYAIWILIAIAFFSVPNMWGWADNTLTLFYALLTVLGAHLKISSNYRWQWSITAIVLWIINTGLQFLMPIMASSPNTISRYSTSSNVLTVIIAYSLVMLISPYLQRPSAIFIFSDLTLIQNTALLTFLNMTLQNKSSIRLGAYTILIVLAELILAWLCSWILQGKLFANLNDQIDKLYNLSLEKQKQQLAKLFKSWLPNISILLVSYIVAAASALILSVGSDENILNNVFTQSEVNLLFSALFCFASIKFLQAITNRFWLSTIVIIAINIVIVIANLLKIQAREEPIVPADLRLANNAGQIFGMVDKSVWICTSIGLCIIIGLIIYLERKHPIAYHPSKAMRIWLILFAPLLFLSSFTWNHTNSPTSNVLNFVHDERLFWNQLGGARKNGPVVQFLNNLDISVMDKPTGYSKTNMEKIRHRYQRVAKQINKGRENQFSHQSLVFVLSESFANPNHVPGVRLKHNPIPYISQLQKNNTGGLMISSGYGGGTANMEYMALTGFAISNFSPTLYMPYSQLVTTLAKHPSIVDNFHYAVGIHPNSGSFYNRVGVYKKFGFNKFYHLGSKTYPIKHQHKIDKNPYLSDQTAYDNALDQLKNKHNGEFINLVTMQNHLPFDQHYYHNNNNLAPVKAPQGTEINSLEDYSTGINYTDQETKHFIEKINKIQKPITIVFYGDHLPGGIYSNSMTKDGLQLHETDYFMYSNHYAREHGARNFKQSTQFVSPTDFIAMAAKQTNSKVNWYQALLTQVFENVPVFTRNFLSSPISSEHANTQFVSRHGKLMKYAQMTKQQKRIYHDYQLVQYDITAGHHYLVNDMK